MNSEKQHNKNKEEIEKLFREYYVMLCHLANRIVHDANAAEDIVQDVFITLWLKSKEVSIHTSWKGYLFKATTNTAINYYTKHKNIVLVQEEEIQHHDAQKTDTTQNQLHQTELKEKIRKAMQHLPPKCKAIFILSKFYEMKYIQIADYLSISIKTVENQMGKALKRIREEVNIK